MNHSSLDNSMESQEHKSIERFGDYHESEEVTSLNDSHVQPSTSECTGQRKKSIVTPLPAKVSRDIRIGYQQQVNNSSVNETNPVDSEVASGFSIAPPLPQMVKVKEELRGVSSQALSDSISAVLVNDDRNCSKGGISADSIHGVGSVLDSIGAFCSYPNLDVATGEIICSIVKKDRWLKQDSYSSIDINFPPKQ